MANLLRIDRDQLKALNNPLRLEILTALRAHGPMVVSQLSEICGKDEQLLYYHLKRLLTVKLVRIEEVRPGATKPESVFASTGYGVVEGLDLEDDTIRAELKKNIQTMFKTTSKEYCQAVDVRRSASFDDCTLIRMVCSLNPDRHEELNEKLRELRQWLLESQESDGEKHSVTIALTPLV